MPPTAVDDAYDGSITVVAERIVGKIEPTKGSGVTMHEAVFRMIGRDVQAGGSPRVEEQTNYSFSFRGEKFDVTVTVRDA